MNKKSQMFDHIIKNFTQPINKYMNDSTITEIMINSPDQIFIEKQGKLIKTDAKFESETCLMSMVNSISQFTNRRINKEKPYLAARLPNGDRIQIILPPCSKKGITISIRKFSKKLISVEKLVENNSITQDAIDFIKTCIQMHKNTIVSGGTSSGKTTILNIISKFINDSERIVVIEDSSELQIQNPNTVFLEAQQEDRRGKGLVTIRTLLACSLRLRPDFIIIGEVRKGEALDLLQALNTGHCGFGTIHSNSSIDTLSRLETLSLFSDVGLSLKALRSQIVSTINIIIHASKFNDGTRKITQISEVLPLTQNGEYKIKDIFRFQFKGRDSNGRIIGSLEPTGYKPTFYNDIEIFGLEKDNIFNNKKL